MRGFHALAFLGAAFLAALGCASTSLTAIRDPAARGRTITRIIVIAPFDDLELRSQAEDALVQELGNRGVFAVAGMTVFPPTRDWSGEDMATQVDRLRAEAVLRVSLTGASTTQAYVPGSSTTTGTATRYGNLLSWNATTTERAGFYVSKSSVHFRTTLLDLSNGSILWMASSETAGNAFAGFSDLVHSLASEVADRLEIDGLIRGTDAAAGTRSPGSAGMRCRSDSDCQTGLSCSLMTCRR